MMSMTDQRAPVSRTYQDKVSQLDRGEKIAELRCIDKEKNHYKTYIVQLQQGEEYSDEWCVTAYWGRIGASVQHQVKGRYSSQMLAEKKFHQLIEEKKRPHGSDGNFYQMFAANWITPTEEVAKEMGMSKKEVAAYIEVLDNAVHEIKKGRKATFKNSKNRTEFSFLEV
jgi:predicted DNA-binding WGR domain protein